MRNREYFKGKKITILGLARSGLACANLLADLGSDVSVSDSADNPLTKGNAAKLNSRRIKFELGSHSRPFIEGRDLVVVSPGIADSAQPLIWAKEMGIKQISEIEVASILCPGCIIAVTGTNGKTTVTTLIGKVLEAAGKKVFVCGNIGNPFCAEVAEISDGDFVCLEVSSFQLEKIETFRPHIAVILNISRNHLDRYRVMEDYLKAKKRIFLNQGKDDYAVLNYDDLLIRNLASSSTAKPVYFRQESGLNPNQSAAATVASILGINKSIALAVFKDFKGIEHRMEKFAQAGGVDFINDSKATTVEAAIWALKNISAPVILIAGGREKGNDYGPIKGLIREKVKMLVLIGESKDKIKNALSAVTAVCEASGMQDAVNKAFASSVKGEHILFSPMCKSFDMFVDYEDRGRKFKEAVSRLISDNSNCIGKKNDA